jgi:hypothetical protein
MNHAKFGDTIKILDNSGYKVIKVGEVYKVLYVETPYHSELERRYILVGDSQRYEEWYAAPRHFEIVQEDKNHAKAGDRIRILTSLIDWVIEGEVYEVKEVNDPINLSFIYKRYKLLGVTDEWYAEPYQFEIVESNQKNNTNSGTGVLNTKDHGKINQGRTIEVQRPSPSIITGQRRSGSSIQGRRNAAIIGLGHLSHKEVIGKRKS